MSTSEITRRTSLRDAVAAYFTAHPHVWIYMTQLEEVGGRGGWRTRISDCRLELHMDIQNKQTRDVRVDGSILVRSFYRYTPPPVIPQSSTPAQQQGLFT